MRADLLLAFTTGLLGGFGHCAGMCGPIVASVGLVASPRLGQRRALLGQVLYNAGRITTYASLGAVMGLTGSFVNVAGRLAGVQRAVEVAVGLLMLLLGLGAAGALRPLARLERWASARVLQSTGAVLSGGGAGRFYALGLLLGLLPCGLSWTVLLGAAGTSSLPDGLLLALAFGLGTVPALLVVGGASTVLSARLRATLYRLGGLSVAILGALFVARGLGLHAGW